MARMDLVAKLRQAPVLERIAAMDWMGGTTGPFVVEFDPTSACDLACPGCISGELLNKEKFSKERVVTLTEEMIEAGVRAVILIGGGEPLTHPAIGTVIRKLGEAGVQIGITTNGTLIDRYLEPIANYANWTRVSVDAGTDETFRYLRPARNGASKFATVIRNMELLALHKRGLLGYSFLIRTEADSQGPHAAGANYGIGSITQSNIHEIYEAARLAKEIGCDYFEPKPSYDDDHYLVVHGVNEMNRAAEQIARARELEDDNFKILESINLTHSLEGTQMASQPKAYRTCPAAEMRTLVTPSGVYVCPYFRGNETKKIGDVVGTTLSEMWNGERRKQVMRDLNPSTACGMHCIRHDTNLELFKIRRELQSGARPEPTAPHAHPDLFI